MNDGNQLKKIAKKKKHKLRGAGATRNSSPLFSFFFLVEPKKNFSFYLSLSFPLSSYRFFFFLFRFCVCVCVVVHPPLPQVLYLEHKSILNYLRLGEHLYSCKGFCHRAGCKPRTSSKFVLSGTTLELLRCCVAKSRRYCTLSTTVLKCMWMSDCPDVPFRIRNDDIPKPVDIYNFSTSRNKKKIGLKKSWVEKKKIG